MSNNNKQRDLILRIAPSLMIGGTTFGLLLRMLYDYNNNNNIEYDNYLTQEIIKQKQQEQQDKVNQQQQ